MFTHMYGIVFPHAKIHVHIDLDTANRHGGSGGPHPKAYDVLRSGPVSVP